jgi:hypothetical protein
MSSTFYKTVLAGAIAAGALLLPATSAQAAGKFLPCDGPGIGDGAFFDNGLGGGFDNGFDNGFDDGPGFWNDGNDDFGFIGGHHHRDHDRTTVIVVTVPQKTKVKHHHKPAAAPTATVTGNSTGAGYSKPAPVTATPAGGYRQAA